MGASRIIVGYFSPLGKGNERNKRRPGQDTREGGRSLEETMNFPRRKYPEHTPVSSGLVVLTVGKAPFII
jgi:hypothetical protein